MPSVTSNRPLMLISCDWRQRLGLTVSGAAASSVMKLYCCGFQIGLPAWPWIISVGRGAISPRFALSKSEVSENGSSFEQPVVRRLGRLGRVLALVLSKGGIRQPDPDDAEDRQAGQQSAWSHQVFSLSWRIQMAAMGRPTGSLGERDAKHRDPPHSQDECGRCPSFIPRQRTRAIGSCNPEPSSHSSGRKLTICRGRSIRGP